LPSAGNPYQKQGGKRLSEVINKELLDIIACPKCKGDVSLSKKGDALICHKCSLVYEIREGIPVMLIDEAITLKEYQAKKDE